MKRFITFILAALLLMLVGCSCNDNTATSPTDAPSNTDVSASDTIEYTYYGGAPGTPLITEDLDVYYEGKIFNGDMPAEDVEEMFGIEFLIKGDNIDGVSYMTSPYYDCIFRTIYYPSIQNKDISISYIINETLDITRIESATVYKGSVGRGISIGDSVDKLVEAYGEPIEAGYYRYYSSYENYNYSIEFYVEPDSKKIAEAYIIYAFNDIVDEWALTPYI